MAALPPKKVVADHLAVTKHKRLFFRRNEPDLHTSSSNIFKTNTSQGV